MATQPQIQGFTDFELSSEGARFAVWSAHKTSLDRTVDVLVPADGVSDAQKAHLLRMARRIARLNSAALPQIYDIGGDASPYIVAEHFEAPSIAEIVKQHGPIGAKEALLAAAGVAEALAVAQTQLPLVLRNIKPQNIRIDGTSVRISDISLAIIAGDPEDGPAADEDEIIGTPSFISPEHAAQSQDVDFRSDIYSLGMTLYFATTGATPFGSSDPIDVLELQKTGEIPDVRQLNPKLPPAFSLLLGRMLMKDPALRYASWGDLLEDIRRLLAGRPLSSRQVRPDAKQTMRTAITTQPARQEESASQAVGKAVAKTLPKSKSHPLAWIILLLWLAWLANARMGNPAGLPPKFAPAIAVPAIDALVGQYLGGGASGNVAAPAAKTSSSTATAAPAPAKRKLAQVPPDPYATLGKGASRPATVATARQPDLPRDTTVAPARQPDLPRDAPVAPARQPDLPRDVPISRGSTQPPEAAGTPPAAPAPGQARNRAIAAIRAGDFAAARKALANDIDAEEAAAMLGEMLPIDEAAGDAILMRRGEEITLTYLGKARTVVPLRRSGATLTVRFSTSGIEKEIPIDLSKVSDAEKLSFMNRWASDPKSHATAAVVALRAGDDRAFKVHAADSGALAPFLTAQ